MRTKIYYFSGTENSFVVARDIANRIKADLLSVPKVMNAGAIRIDADSIGIVFPSYLAPLAGLPLMVERFVKIIPDMGTLRIFAVCTCGGYECFNALPPLKKLVRTIKSRGGRLSGAFSVRLPMNNLERPHPDTDTEGPGHYNQQEQNKARCCLPPHREGKEHGIQSRERPVRPADGAFIHADAQTGNQSAHREGAGAGGHET